MANDIAEAVRHLSPSQVHWYAVRGGWIPVDGGKWPGRILNHPTDGLTQILLPATGAQRDAAGLMTEAVRRLAAFEKRTPADIVAAVTFDQADVLRFRVRSRSADAGTIPLDYGLRFLQGGRDMLLAAACSELQPQTYFPRKSFSQASDFLKSCRIGQSERGSYIATILTPVPPALEAPPKPAIPFPGDGAEFAWADEPFPRRVTLRLMTALTTVRNGLADSRPADLLDRVADGVSSNLCAALADLAPPEDEDAEIEIGVAWSRSRPRVPAAAAARVTFAKSDLVFVEEVARRLKGDVTRRVTITGPVVDLHSEAAGLFDRHGDVTVRAVLDDGHSARVRFTLNGDDYQSACDAHRDTRSVKATGLLVGDAAQRVFKLQGPVQFGLVT